MGNPETFVRCKLVSEMTDDEAIEDLIAVLHQIPETGRATILESPHFRSIDDIVDHLKRRTPEGMRVLEAHKRVCAISEAPTGPIEKIRELIDSFISRRIFNG